MRIRGPTPGMIAVAVILSLLAVRIATDRTADEQTGRRANVLVARVFDGDTFETQDGQRVRLLGIDAPEVAHHGSETQPYGDESGAWLRDLILGREVVLEEGVDPVDRYGRTLAWVFTTEGELINETALATGNAKLLSRFGLPLHLEGRLRQAEAQAKIQRRGLWDK